MLLAWALTCLGLMVLPGPDMALVTRYTLAGGWRLGAATVLGIYGSFFLVSLAIILGLLSLTNAFPEFLDWARVFGGLYLIYLAIRGLWTLYGEGDDLEQDEEEEGGLGWLPGFSRWFYF